MLDLELLRARVSSMKRPQHLELMKEKDAAHPWELYSYARTRTRTHAHTCRGGKFQG